MCNYWIGSGILRGIASLLVKQRREMQTETGCAGGNSITRTFGD
jgi:hypothetical protein